MKLISWNVNGLRACVNKGFNEFFLEAQADVFCLQEIKMLEGQADLKVDGYFQYYNSAEKKGYSGTAVFTKVEPMNVSYGMGIDEHDHEGRMLTLEYEGFYLINVYVPNSKDKLLRLDYRMTWEDDFRAYVGKLNETKPVIVCGDLNVAHKEIDLKNPTTNRKNPGFTDEERGKITELLDASMIDSYRYLYPDQKDAYTWWSYRMNAREKNVGWRIDYFLISEKLKDSIVDAVIYQEVPGSDHCPVGLILK